MRWFGRLRRSSEIAFVRRRGSCVQLTTVAVYAAGSASGRTRVGVTVSKAVGGAVVRNRVRRRIRGALDALLPQRNGIRLLFVAKAAAGSAPFALVARDVATAVGRLVPRE